MSIARLMELKFYLNKFLKVDNIEHYGLGALFKLRDTYDKFIETSKGTDPDFPLIDFGDKGQTIQGVNKVQAENKQGEDDEGEQLETTEILNLSR
nr:MAG TPA: hypothetical protein [Caudoviricetes sp.]